MLLGSALALAVCLAFLHTKSQHKKAGHKKVAAQSGISAPPTAPYDQPQIVGYIKEKSVAESSGITASRSTPGVYWTHNDSGDGPFIYAFDATGQRRGVWRVAGAKARDWEAIASGPGPEAGRSYLYIGDIGDNEERRKEVTIYRVLEPALTDDSAQSTRDNPQSTEPADALQFHYPDGSHNAETILVHPTNGNLYIVTKQALVKPHVYEAAIPQVATDVVLLRHVAELRIPIEFGGLITDGAISPDGTRVVLCDYVQGYELVSSVSSDFDAIWQQPLLTIGLGKRNQGEAITYRLDGRALLATSEGVGTPIIEVVRR